MKETDFDAEAVVELACDSGLEILKWYRRPMEVTEKKDTSPLTSADHAAHRHLVSGLSELTPDIPVLSEESPARSTSDRLDWGRHWLIDPLDGTKEFLKGTGEFTVNVALIDKGRPMVGIVHAPAVGQTYRASHEWGAQVSDGDGPFRPIRTRRFRAKEPILVASRDHAGPAVDVLAGRLGPQVRFTSMGSSLKFCLVADGRADMYLRDRPTMEWDTDAAQCIVEHAGGGVFELDESQDQRTLHYHKPSLVNPGFLCVGDPDGPWRALLQGIRESA